MNWYPQTGAGSVAQFPLHRKRQFRTITNVLSGGERVSLPDANGGRVEWRLAYRDLTDAEVTTLTNFFAVSKGGASQFGFIDPFANLLGWSEDLSKPDWQGGMLKCTGGYGDPVGTQRGWLLQNPTPAEQALSQSLGIPGDYTACFSAYVRSDSTGTIALMRNAARMDLIVGAQWKRVQITGTGQAGDTNSTFGIAVASGASIRVFGLQVEVQPWPSPYRPTGSATGILEETRFDGDELVVTNTSPGSSACEVRLISRL
jgi:hypothetical protein